MSKLNLKNIGVHKWNKTSEKLPPVGCYVLGYLGNRNEPKMLICKREEVVFESEGVDRYRYSTFCGTQILHEYPKGYFVNEITHWMHLPNAPAQEGTE